MMPRRKPPKRPLIDPAREQEAPDGRFGLTANPVRVLPDSPLFTTHFPIDSMHTMKRASLIRVLPVAAFAMMAGISMGKTAQGQSTLREVTRGKATQGQLSQDPNLADRFSIPLQSLPPPPEEVKPWLEAGNVRFVFGPEARQSDQTDARARELAAETRYRIEYRCERKTQWEWIRASRELRITTQVGRVHWQPFHTIWFRDRPETDGFWSNPLVQHELDHVRLSSDPSMEGRFAASLKEPFIIRHGLSGRQRVNQSLIDQLTEQYLQQRFDQILQLIDLRYQELDLVTGHGSSPLQPESSLYRLLRGSPTDRTDPSSD